MTDQFSGYFTHTIAKAITIDKGVVVKAMALVVFIVNQLICSFLWFAHQPMTKATIYWIFYATYNRQLNYVCAVNMVVSFNYFTSLLHCSSFWYDGIFNETIIHKPNVCFHICFRWQNYTTMLFALELRIEQNSAQSVLKCYSDFMFYSCWIAEITKGKVFLVAWWFRRFHLYLPT